MVNIAELINLAIKKTRCAIPGISECKRTKRTELNQSSSFEFLPTDIRLDWETYNIVPQDNQLLDMLVFIGEPLPVIKDGQEVVPTVQEQDCYLCEEKPFIQVKLREHEGARANRPFDVTPSQQV